MRRESQQHATGVRVLCSALPRSIIRSLELAESEVSFEEAVCAAFRTFDSDGSGFLTSEQLQDAMSSLGLQLDTVAIEEMINEAEQNGDGVIDYMEFLAACKVPDNHPSAQRMSSKIKKMPSTRFASQSYDLLVLGAGPAGVKAALEAAGRGFKVGVVEPKECLTGAPTGAHSKCMRESVMEMKVTWPEIRTMISRVTADAQANAARLLRTFHVDVLSGAASFVDGKTIKLTDTFGNSSNIKTSAVVIATGSKANRLPMIPFDVPGVYDSDTIGEIDYIPRLMVVQGGGIIGLEYANIFAKMGTKVIVVEFADKVLMMLDGDLKAALLSELAANKVDLLLSTAIKSIVKGKGATRGSPVLQVDIGECFLECDCFLSATGRAGCTDNLGLEAVGVKTGRGKMIQVDENQYTGVANIYAVGDVAGGNLATIGQAQAVRAVRKMFGSGQYTLKDKEAKPYIVWTIPEVAWVGLNEQEAEAKGLNFGLVRVEYSRAVRGIVSGEKGFLKMIYDRPQGRVLGVHICGAQAGELINFGADAVDDGTTIFEILQFVFPAVTYHVLYNVAATEAKLRMGGVQNLSAAASWARVKTAIMKSLEKQQSQMTFEEAVEATFRTFDADGTGHLTAKQLQASMRSIGLSLSDEAVEDMIKEADQQNQGFVDYPDFVTICRTCGMGPVKTARA